MFEAVKGQSFSDHQEWVRKAHYKLTSHPQYRNTEHAKGKPWHGRHFVALCYDQQGRQCRDGAAMQRAKDDDAFPVWWIWPDQIALVLMPAPPGDANA